MADFDVAAAGLSSPPPLASLTTYRPTILVRNNGIHAALATGTVRIYKAGSLVFSSDVYSATIPPGETRGAQADQYWTPTESGSYVVIGYVRCANDQVEPNNNMAPVTITVGTTPPPPPPVVTAHASQHEEGGQDVLSIDGLPGVAKDKQDPYDHASNHQPGGTDELDVSGLSGELLDKQPPLTHSNDAHDPAFTTAAAAAAAAAALIEGHDDSATAHDTLRATEAPTILGPYGSPAVGVEGRYAREDHGHTAAGAALLLNDTSFVGAGDYTLLSTLLAYGTSTPTDRIQTKDGLFLRCQASGFFTPAIASGATLNLLMVWRSLTGASVTACSASVVFPPGSLGGAFEYDATICFFDGIYPAAQFSARLTAHNALLGNNAPAVTYLRQLYYGDLGRIETETQIEVHATFDKLTSRLDAVFGNVSAGGSGAVIFAP